VGKRKLKAKGEEALKKLKARKLKAKGEEALKAIDKR